MGVWMTMRIKRLPVVLGRMLVAAACGSSDGETATQAIRANDGTRINRTKPGTDASR